MNGGHLDNCKKHLFISFQTLTRQPRFNEQNYSQYLLVDGSHSIYENIFRMNMILNKLFKKRI